MGSVWLADHLTLNTKVAVKFISDRIDSDDPEVMERFVREASTAAQIKSSHVVQTFDPAAMVWPLVPPNTDDAPHAPWWTYGENVAESWNGFLGNPRPEIVGYLHEHAPAGLPAPV